MRKFSKITRKISRTDGCDFHKEKDQFNAMKGLYDSKS